MNTKAIVVMETVKEGRVYSLGVPVGAPFAEAYAVAQEFAAGILELEKLQQQQAQAAQPQPPVEPELVNA